MADKSRIQHVTEKYRLSEETVVDGLGLGRVMSEAALNEFVARDPSGNGKYLDWMLFIAGGGQETLARMIDMWDGARPDDPNSLRNQMRRDFIEERVAGYWEITPENQKLFFPPVTLAEARVLWEKYEPRARYEFLTGDQDIASEDGYGFWRDWPGKNGIYAKVCSAIQLWHRAQPKLKALNAQASNRIELDIYAGWRPNQLSQSRAVYKTLDDLLYAMADLHQALVLRDVRVDTIYEDANVVAVCPLTIGASLKYGSLKWCTANRTDFERTFQPRRPALGNWANFNQRGPLVYMTWKCPMPGWLSKVALHIEKSRLRTMVPPWNMIQFIDVQNVPGGTSYGNIAERIQGEHQLPHVVNPTNLRSLGDPDEHHLRWPCRAPGTSAWRDHRRGQEVLASFNAVLLAVQKWALDFDCKRVVIDYASPNALESLGVSGTS